MHSHIKFHCSPETNFKNEKNQIRAFLYKDYSIEAHNHDFYEMNIVFGGKGTHMIDDKFIDVRAGDVFVIPPMTVHAYYNTENLDVYHILLHKKFVADNHTEAANMPGFLHFVEIEPFLRSHFSEKVFLKLSVSELMQLKSELYFIEENGDFDCDEFIPLRQHTMWKIIYWLSYLLSEQMQSGRVLNKYESTIIEVLEYIHQNYSEKITIEMLCEKTFLSRSTLLRSFQDICGCTPNQYLIKYRCEKATDLLAYSKLSKTQISQRCGFYDLSHMERYLKQIEK